jgi:glutaredoxin
MASKKLASFLVIFGLVGLGFAGCENPISPTSLTGRKVEPAEGQTVTPPFAVRGELEGLLLVWMDREGLHSASKLSEIPEKNRERVRVDSLQIPPDQRLDEDFVYLADLRKPQADGSYPVRKVRRDWFEKLVDGQTPGQNLPSKTTAENNLVPPSTTAGARVIIYGASWCGACRAAASYFRARNIAFEEKDVEKSRDAYAEMQQKASSAGVKPGSLPLIDFRGHIVSGFSPGALDALIGGSNL